MDLSPPTAHLKDANDDVMDVAPADVPVGSIVIVRPGEKIPLDGQVINGNSGVNQAPITGESVPIEKERGDEVFAGTINGDGLLEIETTKAANDTTLARIIKMVGDAGSKKSAIGEVGRKIRSRLHARRDDCRSADAIDPSTGIRR